MERINSRRDLISNLPEHLIGKILARLPLKEAVKTSTLSKRWRYNWITIPHLVFDDSTFSSSSEREQLTNSELLLILHQLLSQHQGAVSKFVLSIDQLGSCPEIDHLISLLTRKRVKKFTLGFAQGNPHKIPHYLFHCLQVRVLCLHNCVFKPPPYFTGFAELTKITFSAVDLPSRFSETFIAHCPLLECLTLHECTNLDCIIFNAPNLKLFDYSGGICSLSFMNTPSLKKVSIQQQWKGFLFLETLTGNNWIETFCSLPSLEYLLIGSFFIHILGLGIVPKRLASNLNCLEVLVLSSISLGHPQGLKCVLCLIKSSPNLRKLKIGVSGFCLPDQVTQLLEGTDSSEFSLEKLQDVQLSHFGGLVLDLEFIELLLAKSPVLERMLIYHHEWSSADKKYSIVQNTNQFQRASPRARVIFREHDGELD